MQLRTTHKMVSKLRKSAYPDMVASGLKGARASGEMREARSAEPFVLQQVPRGRKTAA